MAGGLSNRQKLVFIYLRRCSACLSVVGSSLLLYMIITGYRRGPGKMNTYHRFVLGLTIGDFMYSVCAVAGSLPVPAEISWIAPEASGNTATCTAQGFIIHLFISINTWYNALLLIFYVMVVRYNAKERTIRRCFEPISHLLALSVPLAQALVCLVWDMYNPFAGGLIGCWISAYPPFCENNPHVECTRGENADHLAEAFISVPRYSVLGILVVCLILILTTVETQRRSSIQVARSSGSLVKPPVNKTVRLAKQQAVLYAINFMGSFLFSAILSQLIANGTVAGRQSDFFPLFVLTGLFTPLQGLCNFFIYIRLRYMRLRHQYVDRRWFSILWMTIDYVDGERTPVSPTSFHRPSRASRVALVIACQIFGESTSKMSSQKTPMEGPASGNMGSKELRKCPDGFIEEVEEVGNQNDLHTEEEEGDRDDPVSTMFEPRDINDAVEFVG